MCAAQNLLGLVHVPKSCKEKISIEVVDNIALHPKLRTNEIAITPVVLITPNGKSFSPGKPAIVELIKKVELFEQNSDQEIIPLFSEIISSTEPEWKELGSTLQTNCKIIEDRVSFETEHFSLLTVIVRLPFPSEKVKVQSATDDEVTLTVEELPGFKVEIPPSSVTSDKEIEIKATVYFGDPKMSINSDNNTLASACISLEPHGQKLSLIHI